MARAGKEDVKVGAEVGLTTTHQSALSDAVESSTKNAALVAVRVYNDMTMKLMANCSITAETAFAGGGRDEVHQICHFRRRCTFPAFRSLPLSPPAPSLSSLPRLVLKPRLVTNGALP